MLAELLAAAATWQTGPPIPVPRSEVAGAAVRGEIVIVGGFLADGRSSARVDAYSPTLRRWRRLPDLPRAVNHAMAVGVEGRVYVFGGYQVFGAAPLRSAFVLAANRWRRLAPLPAGRAAAGAAAIGRTIYVVGGIGPMGPARSMLAYDVKRARWRFLAGPTPREHLGVTVADRALFVVGGRANGKLFSVVERWSPVSPRWRAVAPLPEPRGGTAAGTSGGFVVSAGAESSAGTSAKVYAYSPGRDRWSPLPDLPTARHGLAVVGLRSVIYVIGGGPQPGLSVSGANESLDLAG
jgi:N-acetylneuraminic acid mutarotase